MIQVPRAWTAIPDRCEWFSLWDQKSASDPPPRHFDLIAFADCRNHFPCKRIAKPNADSVQKGTALLNLNLITFGANTMRYSQG